MGPRYPPTPKRGDGFAAQYAARIEHCRSQHPHILDQRGATLALQAGHAQRFHGSPALRTSFISIPPLFPTQHDFPFVP